MGMLMLIHIILILGCIVCSCSSEFRVNINCSNCDFRNDFSAVFTIAIFVNQTKVVFIEQNGKITETNTAIVLTNISGVLSNQSSYISATTNMNVGDLSNVDCEIYGLPVDVESGYRAERFRPCIQVLDTDEHFRNGESQGGETRHIFNMSDLSIHLLLSSIICVYFPFIVMPSVWCACPGCAKKWRDPKKTKRKYIRGAISGLVGVVFVIWWSIVLSYSDTQYIVFAVIEAIFIFLYTGYKLLFEVVETLDNRSSDCMSTCAGSGCWEERYYNARVATSHGAVMTPAICWLMIRFCPDTTVNNSQEHQVAEIFFWLFTAVSLISFAVVSHDREGPNWKKKN